MIYLCPQRSCILLTPIYLIQRAIFQANVCTSGRERVDCQEQIFHREVTEWLSPHHASYSELFYESEVKHQSTV